MNKQKIEFATVFLNQLIFGLTPLILMKLLAQFLPPHYFGLYSLITSMCAFILALPFDPLSHGQIRTLVEYQANNSELATFVISSSFLYGFFLFVYLVIFMIVAFNPIVPIYWRHIAWFLFFFVISQVVWSYFVSFFNGIRKRTYAFFIALIALICNCGALLIYFIGFTGKSIQIVLFLLAASNLLSTIIIANGYIRSLFNNTAWHFDKACIQAIWRISCPLIITGVFVWLRSMTNRWLLDWYVDKEAVGAFSILSSIAILVPTALQGILSGYFMPIFYARESVEPGYTRRKTKILISWMGLFGLITSFIVLVLNKWIVVIFSAAHYLQYAYLLLPMYISFFIYILGSVSVLVILAEKRTNSMLIPTMFVVCISSGLAVVMTKHWGLNGAVWNFCITYLAFALMLLWLSYKKKY